MNRAAPARPTVPLGRALAGHETLGALLARVRRSQDCLAAVTDLLPPGLREQVRAGPLDDEGWSLLVPSGAASAKLRQCLPALQARLAERGLQVSSLRVRVSPSGPPG